MKAAETAAIQQYSPSANAYLKKQFKKAASEELAAYKKIVDRQNKTGQNKDEDFAGILRALKGIKADKKTTKRRRKGAIYKAKKIKIRPSNKSR